MDKFTSADFSKIVDTVNGFVSEFEDDLDYIKNNFNESFEQNAEFLNGADTDSAMFVIGKIKSFEERIEKIDEKLIAEFGKLGQIYGSGAGGYGSKMYMLNFLAMIEKVLNDVRGKVNKYCDDFVTFDFSSKFSSLFANEQNYIKDAEKRAIRSLKGFTAWINLTAGTVIPQQMKELDEELSEKEKDNKNTNIIKDLELDGDEAEDLRDALNSLDI